jgi:hypothetical protein
MEVKGRWEVSQEHESMRRRRMNETGVVRMYVCERKEVSQMQKQIEKEKETETEMKRRTNPTFAI